jgi:hypothetical protein
MIAGLLLFSPELKMPEHQQVDTSNMISAISESNFSESSDASTLKTEEVVKSLQVQVTSEQTTDYSKEDISIASPKIVSPYHLIAASFKHEAPAGETLKTYQNMGFSEAQLLHSDNGRYRVSLFSFAARENAVEKLLALRKEEAYKNVWLLTN